MINIKGKTAIVTGGARGIGRAIVLMLAQNGCHVAFNYLKSKDEALRLQSEVEKFGVRCRATCVDIKDFEAVKKWIDSVKADFGSLDILVNNAGIIVDKAFMLMSPEDWHGVIGTNLHGVFNAARACIVTFLKQKSGEIINISSISGVIGLPRQVNYSASKGGVDAFTKALAKEVAPYNVRVNSVAPGYIETDILSGISQENRKKIEELIPLGRVGGPEDVAYCVEFLLSKEGQYITGQVIQVDGGLAIH
ncbi:MAG: 3-oxoacyl-ACP reductase FabG [Candidatus Omnitrophica bacterium]|nr:3-oxoacyl-ACP reductase FabG [Candidatus Omnitrophota bacterium]